MDSSNILSSAAKTLRALRFVTSARQPVNVTQIAEHLDVSHPTAFRIARTLLSESLIEFDQAARTYRASWDLVALAWNMIARAEVRDLARPAIQETVQRFGETITLAAPGGDSIVFVDRVEGTSNVRFYCDVGRRLPLHGGAAAKAILAHLPEAQFEAYISQPLASLTPATKVEPETLRQERRQIRRNGYSISVDEVDIGVSAVGVPILNQDGDVIGAAAIADLTAKWDEKDFEERAEAMLALAAKLNKKCAYLVPERFAG